MNMIWLNFAVLYFAMATASTGLPPGTVLPIMMGSSINAKNDKPGQKIEGKLMQEVQLPNGAVIKKGSKVTGQVISVQRPLRITLRFDQLQDDGRTIPINVSLRALASSLDVFQAALPVDGIDTEQSNQWVTQQVGGEYVFRGRGYVSGEDGKVAAWTGTGVVGKLGLGNDCPDGEVNGQLQALWIFSTTACKTYGFDGKLAIAQDGRAAPVGQITLQATGKDLLVRGGSGWLLLVNPPASGNPVANGSSR